MIVGMSMPRKRFFIIALVVLTVVAGFTLRTAVNHDAASVGDGEFLLSGNDPYYYKHTLSHLLETGETLQFDEMINFPVGMMNPNPPLYLWTLGIGAQAMELFTDPDTAMGLSLLYGPAFWGALTVIPVYFIGREFAGRWGGLFAGFLVATSPELMSRSSLGFSVHDPLFLFLVATGMYFLILAIKRVGTPSQHTNIKDVWGDYPRWFTRQRKAAGAAVIAGALFGGVALSWKGFPYLFAVMLGYAGLQFLMNHWRGKDTARLLYVLATVSIIALALALPYYAVFGMEHFWYPGLYLASALLVMGLFFLAVQRYPAVLVLPGLVVVAGLFAVIMFVVFPDISAALLNRFVYFNDNRLYQTIAEARPSSVTNLSFAVGPIPFFLYIAGFFWLIYRIYDAARPIEVFFLAWVSVDMFMAISAVRFLFTASVTMALLASCALIWIIRSMSLPSLAEGYKLAGGGWRGIRRGTNLMHVVLILFIGLLILIPSAVIAVDAAVPQDVSREKAQEAQLQAVNAATIEAQNQGLDDDAIQEVQQALNQSRNADDFRGNLNDVALRQGMNPDTEQAIFDAAEPHLKTMGWYTMRLGAFGQSYFPASWNAALNHLSTLDAEEEPTDRPGVMTWWDYGHWTMSVGEHPTVADNFQNAFRTSGNFLVAQNETHAIQILGARYAEDMSQEDYVDLLTDHGVDENRAEFVYGEFSSQRYPYIPFGDDEKETREITNAWMKDVEDAYGAEIRYVITDNRMLPIDNPQTGRVENPSIFYAPATLAGDEPEDYVETSLVDMQTGEKRTEEEVRVMQRESPGQELNIGERLFYKEAFFNSMYYRTFVGVPAQEPLQQAGQQIPIPFSIDEYPRFYDEDRQMLFSQSPEVSGFALTQETAPGFGLDNFRLIFANEDVRMLAYTPGATIEGTVTLDGEPLDGVRVTVFDDAGELVHSINPSYFDARDRGPEDLDVPHDSTLTEADGTFSLTSIFGDDRGVEVRVAMMPDADEPRMFEGGFQGGDMMMPNPDPDEDDERIEELQAQGPGQQDPAQQPAQQPAPQPTQQPFFPGAGTGSTTAMEIASERINITREQADAGEHFTLNFDIQPANLTGVTFHDVNADGERDEGEDPIGDVELSIQGQNVTSDPTTGEYRFDGLMPGEYEVTATKDGYQLIPGHTTVQLEPGETTTLDIPFQYEPVDIDGSVVDATESPVENIDVTFQPAFENTTAQPGFATSGADGTFTTSLQPGTYEVGGNGTTPEGRTLEVVSVEITDGTGASVTEDGHLEIQPDAEGVEIRVHTEPDE